MHLPLPSIINLDSKFSFLSLLSKARSAEEVFLDFSAVQRVSPGVLVALTATVHQWKQEGRGVKFLGLNQCPIITYLQRMDLLTACGIQRDEPFTRRESKGRFMPVRLIDHQTDQLGHEMAACIAPGGEDYEHPMAGLYDLVWYVLTETANNVYQHSRGTGYAAAQGAKQAGIVKIAVADNGQGIRRSFLEAGFPWSKALDDVSAIGKALEVRVSSKGGESNEGVGLTLVSELASLMKAWLLIVSGEGMFRKDPDGQSIFAPLPAGCDYPGTLVALTFHQNKPRDWSGLLHDAKIRAGLLPNRPSRVKFQ